MSSPIISLPNQRNIVCLECSYSSGSLRPIHSWFERYTILGNGDVQSMNVKGYLPQDLEHPCLYKENNRYLIKDLKYLLLEFDIDLQHKGKVEFYKTTPPPVLLNTILEIVYKKILSLPDKIGMPAPGSKTARILFNCLADDVLISKTVAYLPHSANISEGAIFLELEKYIISTLKKIIIDF